MDEQSLPILDQNPSSREAVHEGHGSGVGVSSAGDGLYVYLAVHRARQEPSLLSLDQNPGSGEVAAL
jgi:hypothetical protein